MIHRTTRHVRKINAARESGDLGLTVRWRLEAKVRTGFRQRSINGTRCLLVLFLEGDDSLDRHAEYGAKAQGPFSFGVPDLQVSLGDRHARTLDGTDSTSSVFTCQLLNDDVVGQHVGSISKL